jgi:hypothetical protein
MEDETKYDWIIEPIAAVIAFCAVILSFACGPLVWLICRIHYMIFGKSK